LRFLLLELGYLHLVRYLLQSLQQLLPIEMLLQRPRLLRQFGL
jgi:hypothetical protein